MTRPSSNPGYGRLLSLLLRRTEERLIKWEPTGHPYSYHYVGGNGRVVLRSRDEDNDFPLAFEVYDRDGRLMASYLTWGEGMDSDGEPIPWDTAVRRLWSMVNTVNDPVHLLVQELEDMPPF